MNRKQFRWMILRFGAIGFLTGIVAVLNITRVNADTDCNLLYSLEWLVDESNVIAIFSFDNEKGFDNPRVLRTLKGDANQIEWPLTPAETAPTNRTAMQPPASSRVRILFVRGHSELLQSVGLGRKQSENSQRLFGSFYGVTQFGELLLSESAMYRSIDSRLRAKNLVIGRRYPSWDSSTPRTFPRDTQHDYYVLRVPSDTGRRNFFVELFRTGDAAEKVFAVDELSRFRDKVAEQVVDSALSCTVATPVYRLAIDGEEITEWNAESVRKTANDAKEFIKRYP